MIRFKRLLLYLIIAILTGLGHIAIRLVPFKTLIRFMTNVDEVETEVMTKKQTNRLKSVALILNRVNRHVFWRVKCYEQALVALFFARLLGINMMIFFGLLKDENGELLAHTWTEAGDMYITGGENAHAFSVVYKRGYRKNKNRLGYSFGDTRV
ncbi:lasso peptide biosynthesis B2 protein [Petrocella sp. FN5]|uniref:lasso peptide biosynthesis B2 protein n=1 Tax=Petrocella sp. FN5 TaxID=3032002 RepID=UPI0023DAAC69|nr:lasso peptide biosynthesis B2 protein [Petrocella sp. FN5]MDF1618517.1 lasso peptide biosynthesis B2 protein [Petrocella sp. FN5]